MLCVMMFIVRRPALPSARRKALKSSTVCFASAPARKVTGRQLHVCQKNREWAREGERQEEGRDSQGQGASAFELRIAILVQLSSRPAENHRLDVRRKVPEGEELGEDLQQQPPVRKPGRAQVRRRLRGSQGSQYPLPPHLILVSPCLPSAGRPRHLLSAVCADSPSTDSSCTPTLHLPSAPTFPPSSPLEPDVPVQSPFRFPCSFLPVSQSPWRRLPSPKCTPNVSDCCRLLPPPPRPPDRPAIVLSPLLIRGSLPHSHG